MSRGQKCCQASWETGRPPSQRIILPQTSAGSGLGSLSLGLTTVCIGRKTETTPLPTHPPRRVRFVWFSAESPCPWMSEALGELVRVKTKDVPRPGGLDTKWGGCGRWDTTFLWIFFSLGTAQLWKTKWECFHGQDVQNAVLGPSVALLWLFCRGQRWALFVFHLDPRFQLQSLTLTFQVIANVCLFSKSCASTSLSCSKLFWGFPGLRWTLNSLVLGTLSSQAVSCSSLQLPLLPLFTPFPATWVTFGILDTLPHLISTPQLSCSLRPGCFSLPRHLVHTYSSQRPPEMSPPGGTCPIRWSFPPLGPYS